MPVGHLGFMPEILWGSLPVVLLTQIIVVDLPFVVAVALPFTGAKLLKSEIRWLVSGTPIQNKKADFYNLCFMLGMPATFYRDPENIEKISRNFILKRTKKQVQFFIFFKSTIMCYLYQSIL